MKKIGIVGGIAWPSTVDYYSEICRRSEQWHLARNPNAVPSTPEISIESLDLHKVFSYIGNDQDEASWTQFDDYHRAALLRIEASGADFALMASNSPHHRFASITRGIKIPVLNLLQVVAKEASCQGAHEVLILGTALAMRSAKFREIFAKRGIMASGPSSETAKATISAMVFELQRGKIESAAERIGAIAKAEFKNQFSGRPVVHLGCTELPLAFPNQKTLSTFEEDGVLYLNSTALHIDAAFEFALCESSGS
ncbi:MAG TPA: aspartate/glutamate racemase family protein [Candidatus Aquilonibacter sp.]|jgi:aspartate racemase|nr:aspartate/glutamate racemase family protein [Candidatus Aquilonibacter sp.]